MCIVAKKEYILFQKFVRRWKNVHVLYMTGKKGNQFEAGCREMDRGGGLLRVRETQLRLVLY